ncbi:hypothetical protein [Rhodococcus artemisiae]|uniref:Uncharacterized protein n=1 Tax=Rhodococcus artemisiae TaxID=714159 RepID=A0ABU7L4Q3_9NOCA|nr:hypothetical protein [Rhodococcus artemisiae]MEE2056514.1 hypothetical protein [Rhodococcus artemisiae]
MVAGRTRGSAGAGHAATWSAPQCCTRGGTAHRGSRAADWTAGGPGGDRSARTLRYSALGSVRRNAGPSRRSTDLIDTGLDRAAGVGTVFDHSGCM